MKLFKSALASLACFFCFYLIGSFVCVEFNISKWNEVIRGFIGFVGFMCCIFVFFLTLDDLSTKKK